MAERKKGRPNSYEKAIGDEICERIADGESLSSICRDDHTPPKRTVLRWLLAVEDKTLDEFRHQYAQAREVQAEGYFDEILDISDDGRNDWEERESKKGNTFIALNSEAVRRSELRVQSRKWVLSKMLPKKYGDIAPDSKDPKQDLEPLKLIVKDAKPRG